MSTWTKIEILYYKKHFCDEKISASCDDCTKTEEDIDNCFQDIRGDIF